MLLSSTRNIQVVRSLRPYPISFGPTSNLPTIQGVVTWCLGSKFSSVASPTDTHRALNSRSTLRTQSSAVCFWEVSLRDECRRPDDERKLAENAAFTCRGPAAAA